MLCLCHPQSPALCSPSGQSGPRPDVSLKSSPFEIYPLAMYNLNSLLEIPPCFCITSRRESEFYLSHESQYLVPFYFFPSLVSAQECQAPLIFFHCIVSWLCCARAGLYAFAQATSSKWKACISVLMINKSPVPKRVFRVHALCYEGPWSFYHHEGVHCMSPQSISPWIISSVSHLKRRRCKRALWPS